MSDYHQPGYGPGPYPGGPQQPYGAQPGWDAGAPPGGYGQPAGTGYPAGPAYGPQPPPANPASTALWAHVGALLTITLGTMICCGLGAFLGWIAPLAIRGSARHKHDPFVRQHATQAANFGFTQAIVAFMGAVLYVGSGVVFHVAANDIQRAGSGVAVPLLTVVGIMAAYAISGIVCAIIGATKAKHGELWTYPRLIAWPMSKA